MRFLKTIAKVLGIALLALLLVSGVTLLVLRNGDGPSGMIAGGAFTTGELVTGPEPDWAFLRDRQEVQFQLLDPARSRTTWIVEHDGHIYIPSGYMKSAVGKVWKQWPLEAEQNGDAILRVDGRLYERTLVRVRESPALPFIAREMARKYVAVGASPDATEATVQAILAQVANDELWIFELQPRYVP